MKKCTKCKIEKNIEDFSLLKKAKDGRNYICRECRKNIWDENKEELSAKRKVWYQENKEDQQRKCRERYIRKNYRVTKKEFYFKNRLKKFGICLDEYNEMLLSQNNVCAICKQDNHPKKLCVDHCHKTGEVRGLLCTTCNSALGLLNDDIDTIKIALEYLQKYKFKIND